MASYGLVGRLHLETDWSEGDVFEEIISTFQDIIHDSNRFKSLQVTRAGLKSLMVPKLLASYKWTPKEVARRADKPTYALLENI